MAPEHPLEPEPELSRERQAQDEVPFSSDDLGRLTEGAADVAPGYNALLRAIGQLGTHETGNNCQQYSAWFGVACAPWCAYFVAWCFDTSASGNRDRRVPWTPYGTGSSQAIYSWAHAHSRVVPVPQSGDIFVRRDFQHSGIVRGVNTSTRAFNSIDGNWSDKVSAVARNYGSDLYYFIRVATAPV
jgi:hypothetical protein